MIMGLFKRLFDSNLKYLALFFLISCVFHYKAFLEGILIAPNNDALFLNYPVKHLYSYALKSFQFPLWNPYEFAGLPFLGAIHTAVLYPLNLVLYFFLSPPYAFNLSYILHFALGGFFTFLYVRLIGLRHLPAFMAGMVFGFSGFLITNNPHTAIVNSAVYLPLIMYLFEKLRRTPGLKYALLIAMAVAVQIFAGNPQICLYTYLVAGFFMMFHAVRNETGQRARFLAYGASGMALGIVIALPQLISTMELSGLSWMSARKIFLGYDYFVQFHVYLEMLTTLVFPHLFDGLSPEDGAGILIGSLPLILSVMVLIKEVRVNHYVRFWGVVGIVGLFLSLGGDNPAYRLLYHVPVYNQFRAHDRNLFEFTLAVSVLFAFGLQGMFYERQREYIKSAFIGLLSVIVLSALIISLLNFFSFEGVVRHLAARGYQGQGLIGLKKAFSLGNKAIYIPLILMSLYVLWLSVYAKFQKEAFRYLVFILMAVEFFSLSRFQDIRGPKLSQAMSLCDVEPYYRFIEADSDLYRVVNIIKGECCAGGKYNPCANLTCRIGSLTGYEPLNLDKHSSLLEDLSLAGLGGGAASWGQVIRNNVIMGMLGGKYIKISNDMYMDFDIKTGFSVPDRIKMPSSEWNFFGKGQRLKDSYSIFSPDGKRVSLIYQAMSIPEGTYLISLKAKAPGGANKFLGVYLYPTSMITQIPAITAYGSSLLVPADHLESGYKIFHKVVGINKGDLYTIFIATPSEKPVEIKDFSMEKFEHYNPPYLGSGIKKEQIPVYEKLYETADYNIYLNRNYLPRAWSVSGLVPVKDFSEIKRRLDLLEIDPASEAMLYSSDINEIGKTMFVKGEVSIQRYDLNEVSIIARFPEGGFMVVSDQYYPGWKAFIDGRGTKIYKVNGVLRGVVVPKGEHSIVFKYRPYKILFLMAFSMLIVAGAVVYLIINRRPYA